MKIPLFGNKKYCMHSLSNMFDEHSNIFMLPTAGKMPATTNESNNSVASTACQERIHYVRYGTVLPEHSRFLANF